MRKILLAIMILLCGTTTSQAFMDYSFSGRAYLFDPSNLLGVNYPDSVGFNGSFEVDMDSLDQGYYTVQDIDIFFPGFSVSGWGEMDPQSNFYTYGTVFFDVPPQTGDKWDWGEFAMNLDRSPLEYQNFSSCGFQFFYVYDYNGDIRNIAFTGTVDKLELDPVAEPGTIILLGCGLIGIVTKRKILK